MNNSLFLGQFVQKSSKLLTNSKVSCLKYHKSYISYQKPDEDVKFPPEFQQLKTQLVDYENYIRKINTKYDFQKANWREAVNYPTNDEIKKFIENRNDPEVSPDDEVFLQKLRHIGGVQDSVPIQQEEQDVQELGIEKKTLVQNQENMDTLKKDAESLSKTIRESKRSTMFSFPEKNNFDFKGLLTDMNQPETWTSLSKGIDEAPPVTPEQWEEAVEEHKDDVFPPELIKSFTASEKEFLPEVLDIGRQQARQQYEELEHIRLLSQGTANKFNDWTIKDFIKQKRIEVTSAEHFAFDEEFTEILLNDTAEMEDANGNRDLDDNDEPGFDFNTEEDLKEFLRMQDEGTENSDESESDEYMSPSLKKHFELKYMGDHEEAGRRLDDDRFPGTKKQQYFENKILSGSFAWDEWNKQTMGDMERFLSGDAPYPTWQFKPGNAPKQQYLGTLKNFQTAISAQRNKGGYKRLDRGNYAQWAAEAANTIEEAKQKKSQIDDTR